MNNKDKINNLWSQLLHLLYAKDWTNDVCIMSYLKFIDRKIHNKYFYLTDEECRKSGEKLIEDLFSELHNNIVKKESIDDLLHWQSIFRCKECSDMQRDEVLEYYSTYGNSYIESINIRKRLKNES